MTTNKMEKNVAEYLVYLKDNASELRKLGKEWGMTEREIDECVSEALSGTDSVDDLRNSPKNKARKCWDHFLVFMKFMMTLSVVLICLFAVLYVVVLHHEPTQDKVAKIIMPYSYSIMRFLRLATLPLHDMFNITNYYSDECLVKNPFFIEFAPDCNICRSYSDVKSRNSSDFSPIKFQSYANSLKPVKLMLLAHFFTPGSTMNMVELSHAFGYLTRKNGNTYDRNVTYKQLRDMYLKLNGELHKDQHEFVNLGPDQMSLNDLFMEDKEEYVNSSDSLRAHWITRTVKASAALRKLLPRPAFIPGDLEVALEKVVLIDGPNSTTHKLPEVTSGPLQLFIMGSGRRRALVRPVDACRANCSALLAFMQPGDALMYNTDLWRVYLGVNNDEPMVGYILQLQV